MQPRLFAIALAMMALLAGCGTELKMHRAGEVNAWEAEGTQKPYSGIPFPLMFTTFDIDVTHRMVNCDQAKATIATSVVLKPAQSAPDMANMFLLDPASLAGPFKTGQLKVTYLPNGAVASLNAVTEDKSVETIANVVGAAVKVATIGVGSAGAAPGAPAPECPAQIVEALKQVKSAEPQFKADNDNLEKATARLKKAREKLETLGALADDHSKKELSDSLDAVDKATASLKISKASMDKLLHLLTITRTLRWPAHSGQFAETLMVEVDELAKWGGIDLDGMAVTKGLTIGFRLAHAYTQEVPGNVDPAANVSVRSGLPYRLPQPGLLTVCKGPCTAQSEVYARQRANVLQLGPVYYLPCRSPAFSSNSCEISFADSGELKSMGGIQSTATGERMSAALNDVATQYAAYRSARAGADEKDKAAELAAAKREAELRAAQLAISVNPDIAATTAAYTAIAEQNRAELGMIQSGREVSAARSLGASQ